MLEHDIEMNRTTDWLPIYELTFSAGWFSAETIVFSFAEKKNAENIHRIVGRSNIKRVAGSKSTNKPWFAHTRACVFGSSRVLVPILFIESAHYVRRQ